MLIVFTGNGKGKTTAALGSALRALGRGQRVLMVQFIKGPWKAGEDYFADKLKIPSTNFQLKKMGLGFVGILGDSLPFEKHMEAAQKALAYIKTEAKSGQWDVLICDEINVATSLKLLSPAEALEIKKIWPADKILIFTGRGAPEEFLKAADLVTEMKEVKHPFNGGVQGKINIEF